MLIDGNQFDASTAAERVFDVCICGSGPAGMTLALKLARRGYQVALLEAGGLEYTDQSQKVYAGRNLGLKNAELHNSRLRYFGGTSNHWAGWCRALDDVDFQPKRYQEWSGWPIDKSDLSEYAAQAREILDLPLQANDIKQVVPLQDNNLKQIEFSHSLPTRFGEKYLETCRRSKNIYVFLNQNVVDISLSANGKRVDFIEAKNYSLKSTKYYAKMFAVCLGGIENARILLNCRNHFKNGIGNQNDLVGRFFCDHPFFTIGYGVSNEDVFALREQCYTAPDIDFMHKERILNFRINNSPASSNSRNVGIKRWSQEQVCRYSFAARLIEAVRGNFPTYWCDISFVISLEQDLNFSSRVLLSSERDRFDLRRADLDWRLNDLDFHTMRTAIAEIGRQFAMQNLGRVRVVDWLLDSNPELPGPDADYVTSYHHMCTTRMADHPRKGVVDRNLKVFETDNLYIGGSSVFSTGGHTPPTFTIVKLALRLADHIDTRLRADS
jgi:hypothetical protein